MRRIVLISWLVVLSATAGGAVWASQRIASKLHTGVVPANMASVPPAEELPLAAGKIVAVDEKSGRVTINHRGLERFYVEPGTMVFHVQDPTLLTGLAPGDKIRFDVARDGKRLSITRIENSN